MCRSGAAAAATTPTGAPDTPAVAAPAFPGRLYGVTAISSGDLWAVGLGNGGTLELHWDGKQWTIVPGDTPDGDAGLLGVLATWTNNIWVVGTTDYGSTLIVHWNGSAWSSQAGIACSTPLTSPRCGPIPSRRHGPLHRHRTAPGG